MKRSATKVEPATSEQAKVTTDSVKEELPDSTPAAQKTYMDAQSVLTLFEQEEELLSFPSMRLHVATSKNGNTVLRARRNGVLMEVYETDAGMVFPDGLVAGSTITASFSVRKNDGMEVRESDGRRYITAFAVELAVE